MPLTTKGRKIMTAMKRRYGSERGTRVFYASRNKGTISGVDKPYRRGLKHVKVTKGRSKR